jgi:hypothetical protein
MVYSRRLWFMFVFMRGQIMTVGKNDAAQSDWDMALANLERGIQRTLTRARELKNDRDRYGIALYSILQLIKEGGDETRLSSIAEIAEKALS